MLATYISSFTEMRSDVEFNLLGSQALLRRSNSVWVGNVQRISDGTVLFVTELELSNSICSVCKTMPAFSSMCVQACSCSHKV